MNKLETPIIEIDRLLLRPFTFGDIQEVYDCWQSDADVARYMMWESSEDIEKAKEFINFELSMLQDDKWFRWCIVDKMSKNIYGTCLVYFNDDENCWDISYNLGKKYWGKGYMTEAMKSAMDYISDIVGVKEYIAAHAIENTASGRVIEKLGFQYEKDIPYICNGGNIQTTGRFYRLNIE